MGRVKLQIKKIENTTNRQVTFSKRRNGLIKKAYELSVLCEVDVAVIMFSPSGRLCTFSGNNKSIEDIVTRYVNLPEQDRGRLQNKEYLQRVLGKLKSESSSDRSSYPASGADSQLAEIQHELEKCKSKLVEMEQRLRVYECDPFEITTLCEAQYRERIFEHNLNLVRYRKRVLEEEEKFNHVPDTQTPSEVNLGSETTMNTHDFAVMDNWQLPGDHRDPHSQLFNFLDPNGLFPLRDETGRIHQHQPMENMVAPALPLLHVENAQLVDHHVTSSCRRADDTPRAGEFFGQIIDVNVSPWTEYGGPPAANVPLASTYPRDRAILEAFISQLTTPSLSQHQDQI